MGVAPVARSQNDTTWLPPAVQSRLHVTTQKDIREKWGRSTPHSLKHEYGLSCFAVNGSSGTQQRELKISAAPRGKNTFLELLCQETPRPIAPNIHTLSNYLQQSMAKELFKSTKPSSANVLLSDFLAKWWVSIATDTCPRIETLHWYPPKAPWTDIVSRM